MRIQVLHAGCFFQAKNNSEIKLFLSLSDVEKVVHHHKYLNSSSSLQIEGKAVTWIKMNIDDESLPLL